MIIRRLESQLTKAISKWPAVVLIGPRQIGKTTLAFAITAKRQSIYLDLENPTDLLKIQDVSTFYQPNSAKLIILDEVQRKPEIFGEIRGIIDAERRQRHTTGLFLFLGSASLDLLRQSSESLAGRTVTLELYPIDALEYDARETEKLNRLWHRGGFPDSLLADSDTDSLDWRQNFIRTYVERDIALFGPRIPAETMMRFWTMLANNQGSTLNASQLAKSLDVSQTSIKRYLDLFTDLLLVRQLRPWSSNLNKRLVRSPKVYIRDSGIVHALLNIHSLNALLGHPVQGGSWEGFVIENILSVLPHRINTFFYTSQAGAEIDLILEISTQEKWAIDIKRSSAPTVTKGFHIASEDVGATKKFIIYPGQESFSIGQGLEIITLVDFMKKVMVI